MNIELIRQKTKGLDGKLFFNSAGASLMQDEVVNVMNDYLEQERMMGGYGTEAENDVLIQNFYTQVAKLTQTNERNIAFTTSAGDAYTQALAAIPFSKNEIIITTNNDYVSNQLAFIMLQKRYGLEIVRVKDLDSGGMDVQDCIEKIKSLKPKLVAITHIPTNSGLIQDIYGVADACKESDAYYLVDACQTFGQMSISVKNLHCDFLTATGRKFMRGPRGSGFLYVSDRVLNEGLSPLFTDQNGADWISENDYKLLDTAKRFERWEKNYSALLGLAKATELINEIGIVQIEQRNRQLQLILRTELSKLTNIKCTDRGINLCNLVTFTHIDGSIDTIEKLFKTNNIQYSISGINGALIDFTKRNLTQVIRLSPHYFNTDDEIKQLILILATA